METAIDRRQTRTAPLFGKPQTVSDPNHIPSSSPGFGTPDHPIRDLQPREPHKPTILPVLLPPATLRPLAFRTFTKKHNLTLTSSALQLFATFIGKHCGSGWREDGLAEKVLDEAARSWKKSGGGVLVPGEGTELVNILGAIEGTMTGGRIPQPSGLSRQSSFALGVIGGESPANKTRPGIASREESFGMSGLGVEDDTNTLEDKDPRKWLKIIGALEQPRLAYNVTQKHFEAVKNAPLLLPEYSQKTQLFRHRYSLIHQRLLRNESFQTSLGSAAGPGLLQRSASTLTTAQHAYKLTPIANLLGRSGSNHMLLGMLSISPTGVLTLNDLTGSIALNIQHARPVPEDSAWFAPGMIVVIDGVYEEEGSGTGPGLDGIRGVGGTLGGEFVAFSFRTPPGESRDVTLGVIGEGKNGILKQGGGFGWVDFLGVGSERAVGTSLRKLERSVFRNAAEDSAEGRGRMVIIGEVELDSARTLQAIRKILGSYAAEPAEHTPMVVVLMGNFVRHAVMAGGGSGGSIEYKEYFDSLASALSDYPTMLQSTTWVFVPGDNDPWASAFSAGAATIVPRANVPELFTSRIKRAFSTANADAGKFNGTRMDGEAVWTTNPTRLTLFGPAHEVVFFRDDMSGRLRRNAVRFRSIDTDSGQALDQGARLSTDEVPRASDSAQAEARDMSIGTAGDTAESAPDSRKQATPTVTPDTIIARKLVKTVLDQGYLSPFPLTTRPVLWDYAGTLQLYPLPTALVLMDPEAPSFALTYGGCHVMNPGPITPRGRRGVAQWMEYDSRTRRGNAREVRY
ncbi:DNA-directed DNA polymerase epsilon, subunit B [Puttea exsequens]|nr:DNA-directed DNA polymerase epsilon, subunit B [Puttea exsequens]